MITYKKFKDLRYFSIKNIVPAFESAGYIDRASKIKHCGDFTIISQCKNCGTNYFDGWYACRDRFCPLCQKKKSLQYVAKLMPILLDLSKKGYFVNIVNFTIKDNNNLKYSLDLLYKAFRYIQHDNKYLRTEFNKRFVGGIRSLEIKKGKNSNEWHPHFHCIVVKKDFSSDFEYLRDAWEKALSFVSGNTTDKLGSVWLHSVNCNNRKELLKSIVESLKYVTKYDGDGKFENHTLSLSTLDASSIIELVESTQNVRSLSTWGLLYNFKNDDVDNNIDNLITKICKVCNSDKFEDSSVRTDCNNDVIYDFNSKDDKLIDLHNEYINKLSNEYVQICFDDLECDSDKHEVDGSSPFIPTK